MRTRTPTAAMPVLLVALALLLAACGGGDSAEEATTTTVAAGETTTTPGGEDATPTTASDGATTTEPQEDQTTTTMEPEAALPFLAANEEIGDLAGVGSYRVRMDMSVSGDALSQDEAFDGFSMEGAFVADPPAQQVSVSVGGEAVFEQITIGDQAWLKAPGDDAWISIGAAGSPLEGLTSAFFQPDFTGADEEFENLGAETVNGRDTIHYRGDLTPYLLSGLVQSADVPDLTTFDLDVWADPAGFVVKMEMVMEGSGFDTADPDATGRIEYSYEIYDFGADISIAPPL